MNCIGPWPWPRSITPAEERSESESESTNKAEVAEGRLLADGVTASEFVGAVHVASTGTAIPVVVESESIEAVVKAREFIAAIPPTETVQTVAGLSIPIEDEGGSVVAACGAVPVSASPSADPYAVFADLGRKTAEQEERAVYDALEKKGQSLPSASPAPPASILLYMPTNGPIEPGAAHAFYRTSTDFSRRLYFLDEVPPVQKCSNLGLAFNAGLCYALNGRDGFLPQLTKLGRRTTHFAMLHADLVPRTMYWLDILFDEMQRTGADWICAASPIKTDEDLTSIAVGNLEDRFDPWYRFTEDELHKLPETFTMQGPRPLLLNTGCMLLDIRKPWWREVVDGNYLELDFSLDCKIRFTPGQGWMPVTESEDWRLSRLMVAKGAKLYCTRKVMLGHVGQKEWEAKPTAGGLKRDAVGGRVKAEAMVRAMVEREMGGQYGGTEQVVGAPEASAAELEAKLVTEGKLVPVPAGASIQTPRVSAPRDSLSMVTYEDLIAATEKLIAKLPPGIVGVLGIPVKGMVPASIVASRLHVPLGDSDGIPVAARDGTILVVDDGVGTGETMRETLAGLKAGFPERCFLTAAALVIDPDNPGVDYWGAVINPLFQFQEAEFLNTEATIHYAVDFDGVLCENPPFVETDEPASRERQRDWCLNAPPLYLPRRVPVAAIVTSRLEKYRPETEAWLQRWGVKYRRLVMDPAGSVAERERSHIRHGWKKGNLYAHAADWRMFVESHADQAWVIVNVSAKPVFCVESKRLVLPPSDKAQGIHVGEVGYIPARATGEGPKTWRDIEGWFDDSGPFYGVGVYREIVAELPRGAAIVEVGCWVGRSTACMLTLLREANKSSAFFVVDTFEGSPTDPSGRLAQGRDILEEWNANLRSCGFTTNSGYCDSPAVTARKMPSVEGAELFADAALDFVYIDASHTQEAVTADLAAWWPKVKPGGVMAGHDYDGRTDPGVVLAVQAFAREHPELEPQLKDTRNWWIRKPVSSTADKR